MGNLIKNLNQAVITLGGKGTRLRGVTQNIPKPLWEIEGFNTLERSIKELTKHGINSFIWLTNYKSNLFLNESKRLSHIYKVKIYIHQELTPKGEAGSLLDLVDKLDNEFIFLNGDIIFNMDIKRMYEFHIRNNSKLTFVTHLSTHPEDSDCIIEDLNLSIYKYKFKNETTKTSGFYLGNAGLSIISKSVIKLVSKNFNFKREEFSLFKDIIIYAHQNKINVFSYNTSEYLKDMGTPKRLLEVTKDIKLGIVQSNAYLYPQKTLFLDRDNTLNKCLEGEYIIDINQINLFEHRIKKLAHLSTAYTNVILVTNQPQISMGKVSWQKVIEINGEIINRCRKLGLNISSFYICPHHNNSGFEGEIKSLKRACFCRKPLPGLFLEAAHNRNIDLKSSLMIGDSWRDKKAAESLQMKFQNINLFD